MAQGVDSHQSTPLRPNAAQRWTRTASFLNHSDPCGRMVETPDAPFPMQRFFFNNARRVLHIQPEKHALHFSLPPLQAFYSSGDSHAFREFSSTDNVNWAIYQFSGPSHNKRHLGPINSQQDKPLQDQLDITPLGPVR